MTKLEADIQRLIETFCKGLFLQARIKLSTQKELKHSKAIVEEFTKAFQRHTALTVEQESWFPS